MQTGAAGTGRCYYSTQKGCWQGGSVRKRVEELEGRIRKQKSSNFPPVAAGQGALKWSAAQNHYGRHLSWLANRKSAPKRREIALRRLSLLSQITAIMKNGSRNGALRPKPSAIKSLISEIQIAIHPLCFKWLVLELGSCAEAEDFIN